MKINEKKYISAICPIYQEGKFIRHFLESILEQDYPKNKLEVILVDGMSTDGTREIIKQYAEKHPFFRLIDNPWHTVPFALNKGIEKSKGDVIIRLDAHCKYPNNYISELSFYLYKLNADNVGGVWDTRPANQTTEAIAVAACSSHPFGVGGSEHKIGVKNIKEVNTVPFGCYRKEVFERIGLFDEELTRNQDDEFNGRLLQNKGKIYIIPGIAIEYTARESIIKMRKMYYQYGLFKPLVNKKLGHPATLRQFVPSLFCIGLILGGFLAAFSKFLLVTYAIVVALYFIISTIIGIKFTFLYKKIGLWLYVPYTFLNIHLSYGFGYLYGCYKVMSGKKFNVKINR